MTGSSTGARKRFCRTTASASGTRTFLEFVAKEHLFAKMGTPAREANGDRDKRWDTSRISAFSEILAFYGVDYWYAWQVTILGLGPIWQSDNAWARRQAAQWLDDGAVFAFGLSEREHGADIYTTDMVLTPDGGGGFRATGGKYYIGNGNVSRIVSVFGRRSDVDGPDGYVFFAADSQHENYRLIKNIVQAQMFVAEFRLENYNRYARRICCTPGKRPSVPGVEHGERRQVQHRARLHRHVRTCHVQGGGHCPQPHPLRQPRD